MCNEKRRHHSEGERAHGRGHWHHDHGHHEHVHHHHVHHDHGGHRDEHGPGGEGPGRHGRGGRGGRARRGEARFLLLDVLRDSPKHGYEIIKALEERSGGQYVPSPGTVYPTLQMLEDQGLVRADQEAERRVYHLTDAGRAELEAHAEELSAFWARLEGQSASQASQTELNFLRDEVEELIKTMRSGLRGAVERDDQEPIRKVRQAIERCKNEVRSIITGGSTGGSPEVS